MIELAKKSLKNRIQSAIKGKVRLVYFEGTDTMLIEISAPNIEYRHIVKSFTNLVLSGELSTLSTRVIHNFKEHILSTYLK